MPPASTPCLAKQDRRTGGPRAAVPDPKHRELIRDIGTENRRVITMDWMLEGVTLIFGGTLTPAVSRVRDDSSTTTTAAYAVFLIVTTVISPRTRWPQHVHRLPALRGEPHYKRDTPAGNNRDLITAPPVNRGRRRRGRTCLTRNPRRHGSLRAGSSGSSGLPIVACTAGPVADSACGDRSPVVGAPCALPPSGDGRAAPAL